MLSAGALLSTQSSVFKYYTGTDLRQSGYTFPCTGRKGRCILYNTDYLPRCLDLCIALYTWSIYILYGTILFFSREFVEKAKHQTTNTKKNISVWIFCDWLVFVCCFFPLTKQQWSPPLPSYNSYLKTCYDRSSCHEGHNVLLQKKKSRFSHKTDLSCVLGLICWTHWVV